MVCQTCHGSRVIRVGGYDSDGQPVIKEIPCTECRGTGEQ